MKVLTLLRHAKSGWDDPVLRDFDRPLNPRGRRAARTVTREIRRLGLGFDRVLASPARRVIETLEEVGQSVPLAPDYDQRLYLASSEALLELARGTKDGVDRLLLVAHNPGLEELALRLSGAGELRDELALKYPTATLAELEFDVASWRQVRDGGAILTRFIRPRDLDPALGPED
ncbi:MAG TPA: histidine phosphatase family protein [Allosphingosinicella sp.]|jgi:phosphohistidine phosphatase